MAKKKDTSIPVSQEDTARAQQVLEQFHKIANSLHTSSSRTEAETALADINNLPEAVQMALVKALSKERHVDAADVLVAVNELGRSKAVRKEARRSLIRLEEGRIYPAWRAQVDRSPTIDFTAIPPRFWKGFVTDTFESGEVELLLLWELGENYSQTRILGFLLEFWHDGIKDFFTEVAGKRHAEEHIAELHAHHGLNVVDCTLADGRRLIQDALAVNKRYGTIPYRDYRTNYSLVKQLVLDATDLGEDTGIGSQVQDEAISSPRQGMTPEEVVTTFVESLALGDYELAYELLSSDSSIREELSQEEWVERRRAWAEEAEPADLKPEFLHEIETKHGGIWLPSRFRESSSSTRKEFDAGWSIVISDTPLSEGIKELPMATAINTVTDRHWYWARYTLVQDQDEWRIESMSDEGANAHNLPAAELQERLAEQDKQLEQITKKHKPTDPDSEYYLEEILWHVGQFSHYSDALIAKMPYDRSVYEQASANLLALKQLERGIIYFEPRVLRFDEKKSENLLGLASFQMQLRESLLDEEEVEASERYEELAEANIREALAIQDTYLGHLLLAELLKEDYERLDEAEDHLQQAKALNTSPSQDIEFTIENNLGEVAMEQEQYDKALQHFQRAAEIFPDSTETWNDIAEAYNLLDNVEEAEANYRHAIELEPDNVDFYVTLSRMFLEHDQLDKSREVLEEGLQANPDSAELRAFLALAISEGGDYRKAEELLEEAERINPDLEMVEMFRMLLNVNKTRQLPPVNKTRQLAGGANKPQLPNTKRAKNKAKRK